MRDLTIDDMALGPRRDSYFSDIGSDDTIRRLEAENARLRDTIQALRDFFKNTSDENTYHPGDTFIMKILNGEKP